MNSDSWQVCIWYYTRNSFTLLCTLWIFHSFINSFFPSFQTYIIFTHLFLPIHFLHPFLFEILSLCYLDLSFLYQCFLSFLPNLSILHSFNPFIPFFLQFFKKLYYIDHSFEIFHSCPSFIHSFLFPSFLIPSKNYFLSIHFLCSFLFAIIQGFFCCILSKSFIFFLHLSSHLSFLHSFLPNLYNSSLLSSFQFTHSVTFYTADNKNLKLMNLLSF